MERTFPGEFLREGSQLIYKFINGIIDIDGNPTDLASTIKVSPKDYLHQILEIRNSCRNAPLRLAFQTNSGIIPFSSFQDIFLDDTELVKDERYIQLPEEEQNYVLIGKVPENCLNGKSALSEHAIQLRTEYFIRQDTQKNLSSGFVHFIKSDVVSDDRIYIKVNKDKAINVTSLIISELYGLFPGVISVKVTGPGLAGRSDAIVIYLSGGDWVREAVVKKLREIREPHAEWFSHDRILCKKNEAPGIATIPNLGNDGSFTFDLSLALHATFYKFTGEDYTLQMFRGCVVAAFFSKRLE